MTASPNRLAMPRGRGTASGLLIMLLGLWGALAPLVGPYFDWSIGGNEPFEVTSSRLLLQVLPGALAFVGGLMLVGASNRAAGGFGALLAIIAGIWFVVGPTVSMLWNGGTPDIGQPFGDFKQASLELLSMFYGLGALLCVLGGIALTRVMARLEGDTERAAEAQAVARTSAAGVPTGHAPQRDRALALAQRPHDREAAGDAAPTVVGETYPAGGATPTAADPTVSDQVRADPRYADNTAPTPRPDDLPPPPNPDTRAG